MKLLIIYTVLFVMVLVYITCSNAQQTITLKWNANSESDLAGYEIFMRKEGESYDYSSPIWKKNLSELADPNNPTAVITDLDENITYMFVAKAFDTDNNESADSNEVTRILPVNNCSTTVNTE